MMMFFFMIVTSYISVKVGSLLRSYGLMKAEHTAVQVGYYFIALIEWRLLFHRLDASVL